MNTIILIGRLTRDVETSTAASGTTVARYTLAVDRRGKDAPTDFIPCVSFNKAADFAAKWLHKGTKICVRGELQTGSYTDKDGNKRNTYNVVVSEHDFCERPNTDQTAAPFAPVTAQTKPQNNAAMDGFMSIPDGIQEELPFE